MKTTLLVTMALFLSFGCAKQELSVMTPQDQETAKQHIRQIFSAQAAACERGDLEALLQDMSKTPHFLAVMTDGSTFDFAGAKKATAELLQAFPSVKFSTTKEEFRFLANDLVLFAWTGTCDLTSATGDHFKIDTYAVTYIFRQMDNNWKIIFSHESALPPVQQKPAK